MNDVNHSLERQAREIADEEEKKLRDEAHALVGRERAKLEPLRTRSGPPRSGVVAVERRTQRFHYPLQAASPEVLEALPASLVAAREPFGERAEQFRALRGRLLSTIFATEPPPALAILGAEGGEGKTYLAANLAISFSQCGGRTLLVDANLRRPVLHELLRTPRQGLADVLTGKLRGDCDLAVPGLHGLHLLPAGTVPIGCDPVELLLQPSFGRFLEEMVESFDHVIIDTAADRAGPEGRVVAARAGAAIVVGRKGHSRMARMRRLLQQLGTGPACVAGVVMNEH
jgi:Mrp family chromosome partitioning ATPase